MDTAKSVVAGAYGARRSPARALIAATRPWQWVKNLLVLAALGLQERLRLCAPVSTLFWR